MSTPNSPICTPTPPNLPVASQDAHRVEASASTAKARPHPNGLLPREVADAIVAAFAGLEFGSIEITVHNSRVVQIERYERIRFSGATSRPEASPATPPASADARPRSR